MNETNSKYLIASILMAILLIVAGGFEVFYIIVFIHSNSLINLITSLLLAVLGAYYLYNRQETRKKQKSQNAR